MKEKFDVQFLKPTDPMAEWDSFVTNSPQGCIFCRSWWLDAVCPNQYQIMLLRQGNKILVGMPLRFINVLGFNVINMPPFTQTLGVLLPPSESNNYEKNLSSEMEVLKCFIQSIPKVSIFEVSFHFNFANWLPFFWAGYRQTTLYSYVLENLCDLEKIIEGFAYSKRKNIKKAEKLIEIREDLKPEDFYNNHMLTLRKQGKQISYKPEIFYRIHAATSERNACKIWYATDKMGQLHAAIFIVYDSKSAHFLISSIDPDHRNSGAVTLLVKHALEYFSNRTQRFDFEGSMIEEVETSFRRFGARQMPYFAITRSNIVMSGLVAFRKMLKK